MSETTSPITTTKISEAAKLIFTEAAAAKVKKLIDEEENPALNLRVSIAGGGCSGFQYSFTFDETIRTDDIVVKKQINNNASDPKNEENSEGGSDGEGGSSGEGECSVVKLLIDPLSFQYLKEAEIDYREDVHGAQFVIRNPNAKTTCGCGSSFST